MLNPFFIQGTSGEQGLVQDLINEQLRMYGIEVYYMPREIVSKGKIIKEVLYSKFSNAFPIEAYLSSYEGFDSNSILMSKFGVKITDEMNLIISKERFEIYISELMKQIDLVENYSRPNEGDLLYIPLSDSLMEIKYVENRKPFYQLQKNYVYELRCELYELEDDEIKTNIGEIDVLGAYESTLQLSGIGLTATAYTTIVNGAVQKIEVLDSGYGYKSSPTITISSPIFGTKARSIGVVTSRTALLSAKSLDKIYLENPGSGYNPNSPPIASITGGGGYGSQVRVGIATSGSIGPIILQFTGQGYYLEPVVSISSPVSGGTTAIVKAFLNGQGGISTVRIINAGYGYTESPTVTISAGSTVSSGNFIFNETVYGSISGASGVVNSWNADTKILKVTGFGTVFIPGDYIVGAASSATYIIAQNQDSKSAEGYDQTEIIQEESDGIIDFTEINPFGEI
jgi:hypothetical protein